MLEKESEVSEYERREGFYCACLAGPFYSMGNLRQHEGTKAHLQRLDALADGKFGVLREGNDARSDAPEPTARPLDADLQAVINATSESPQQRAKMVRHAFAVRGWPNAEHPGTVRDFLMQWNIPIAPEARNPSA